MAGMQAHEIKDRSEKVLEETGLSSYAQKLVNTYVIPLASKTVCFGGGAHAVTATTKAKRNIFILLSRIDNLTMTFDEIVRLTVS